MGSTWELEHVIIVNFMYELPPSPNSSHKMGELMSRNLLATRRFYRTVEITFNKIYEHEL
jgi:hypothetical protein